MCKNVIVNIKLSHRRFSLLLMSVLIGNLFVLPIKAQQANREEISLIPFAELLKRPVIIRPELNKVHPRLFFTKADLPNMRERSNGVDKELWQETLNDLETL